MFSITMSPFFALFAFSAPLREAALFFSLPCLVNPARPGEWTPAQHRNRYRGNLHYNGAHVRRCA